MGNLSVKFSVGTPTSKLYYVVAVKMSHLGSTFHVYMTDRDAENRFGGPIFSRTYRLGCTELEVFRSGLEDFAKELPRLIDEYENISTRGRPFSTSGYGNNY